MATLVQFLDDPASVRMWVAAEDDPRWDDPEDHGDPKIERFGDALAAFGPRVIAEATLACAELIAPVWTIDVGDNTLFEALAAARSRDAARIADAARAVANAERLVRWAHTSDARGAAECALAAARAPTGTQLRHAALFAFRVLGWSVALATAGEVEIHQRLATVDATDDIDRCRQLVRLTVRAALVG
jgi:hypothetical protein